MNFYKVKVTDEIKRESCSFEVMRGISYTRTQFPLMLAFAITIHKALGLGLQAVMLDIQLSAQA